MNLQNQNQRRVNLAMTAELALGNGNKMNSNMPYNAPVQGGGIARIRGGVEGNASNDILGTYLQSGAGGAIGSSSKGFAKNEENKDFPSYKSSNQTNPLLPPRGYNPNNEFSNLNGMQNNNFNTGLTTNNNITNQYKPSGGFGGNNDILNSYQQSSHSNIGSDSNGFKIQRVRGTGNQAPATNFGVNSKPNNSTNLGQQTLGNGNGGFGFNSNNLKKDENTDIDFQTKQLTSEIDQLDQKLNFKYQQDPSPRSNNAFKASSTNFGSNNNINTAFSGSNQNFYTNNSNNENQFNSTSSGSNNNNMYGNGFGTTFGNSSSNNNINGNNININNNNNAYQGNGSLNAFNSSGNNFTATTASSNSNTTNNPQSNSNNRLPPRGRPPLMGQNSNNLEDTYPSKPDTRENPLQSNEVKKIPVNSNVFNENANKTQNSEDNNTQENNNQNKEFSTGTYDPSNILNTGRQGRMRSLGRNNNKQNQHEEKPAQATGCKNLPDQVPLLEEFKCPEGCGRTFNKKALAKHIPLCKKLFQPKKEEEQVEQKKVEVAQKNPAQDKKQVKPPKAAKKPDSKEVKQRDAKNDLKNEALKKLKEQKKKELQEKQEQEKQNDDDIISEPNDNDYI